METPRRQSRQLLFVQRGGPYHQPPPLKFTSRLLSGETRRIPHVHLPPHLPVPWLLLGARALPNRVVAITLSGVPPRLRRSQALRQAHLTSASRTNLLRRPSLARRRLRKPDPLRLRGSRWNVTSQVESHIQPSPHLRHARRAAIRVPRRAILAQASPLHPPPRAVRRIISGLNPGLLRPRRLLLSRRRDLVQIRRRAIARPAARVLC